MAEASRELGEREFASAMLCARLYRMMAKSGAAA
jgi:hypothetical protein